MCTALHAKEAMNITFRALGIFGVFLFGILLSVTFISPETIEESAKGFVKKQIINEVREMQQIVNESSVTEAALNIAGRLGFEKDQIQANLNNGLDKKIASIIASMCGYDCEKKKVLAQSIASSYMNRIGNIEVAENTLSAIVNNK